MPRHRPSTTSRRLVARKIAAGSPLPVVAREMRITLPTLEAAYSFEIENAEAINNAAIAENTRRQAEEGRGVAAAISARLLRQGESVDDDSENDDAEEAPLTVLIVPNNGRATNALAQGIAEGIGEPDNWPAIDREIKAAGGHARVAGWRDVKSKLLGLAGEKVTPASLWSDWPAPPPPLPRDFDAQLTAKWLRDHPDDPRNASDKLSSASPLALPAPSATNEAESNKPALESNSPPQSNSFMAMIRAEPPVRQIEFAKGSVEWTEQQKTPQPPAPPAEPEKRQIMYLARGEGGYPVEKWRTV